MTIDSDNKIVFPARFKASRVSDLRRYFSQEELSLKWRKTLQGQLQEAVHDIGISNADIILDGLKSYIEMLRKYGPDPTE